MMVYMDVWATLDAQHLASESSCKPFGIRQYVSAVCPGHVFLAPKQQKLPPFYKHDFAGNMDYAVRRIMLAEWRQLLHINSLRQAQCIV